MSICAVQMATETKASHWPVVLIGLTDVDPSNAKVVHCCFELIDIDNINPMLTTWNPMSISPVEHGFTVMFELGDEDCSSPPETFD